MKLCIKCVKMSSGAQNFVLMRLQKIQSTEGVMCLSQRNKMLMCLNIAFNCNRLLLICFKTQVFIGFD